MVTEIAELLTIMRQLRDKVKGCEWDRQQDFDSIAPYTIEEAYEVADVITRQNWQELKEELGDLLFQVVFHAQMADELGYFSFDDVVHAICQKMIHRHPHIFDANQRVKGNKVDWETLKAKERATKEGGPSDHLLADIPDNFPALLRSHKFGKRMARAGFDWRDPSEVFDKLDEEKQELQMAMRSENEKAIAEEMGDYLFASANLARKLGGNPETLLRQANVKFERRVQAMERLAQNRGEDFASLSIEEQEKLWIAVKKMEKQAALSGD